MLLTRIIVFVTLLLMIAANTYSQSIYWANELVGYSSQQSNKEYSANQALGEPSIMPYQGLSACSWMPKFPTNKIEWIRVRFPEKIHVNEIIINENLNPGAIVKVVLYDSIHQGYLVYNNNLVSGNASNGRLLKIPIEKTAFKCRELKIEVNLSEYLDYYQIDAIGIADHITDFELKVNAKEYKRIYIRDHLGSNVNSPYRELAPIISQDGKTLVFTREGHPENVGMAKKQDVWMSKIDSFKIFQPAINLGSPINNENANFAISVSTDANEIVLGNIYLPNGKTNVGYSKSRFTGHEWTYPDSLKIKNFYSFFPTGSGCLANNGKFLITSIKREDSYGKTDLYVSFLDRNDLWSEPVNLGPVINTAEEELSPYLAGDNKTLYFSSGGFPGFGSNDMYMTKRLDDTWQNWSHPINLGRQINSEGWDAYYTITADGQYAYFVSSDKVENAEDIYRIELPDELRPEAVVLVRGRVLHQNKNQPVDAIIKYETLPDGKEIGIARANPLTGEYSILLPAGNLYGFAASAPGFISINENLDLRSKYSYSELTRDLYLAPMEMGQIVRINNIFFEYKKYNLLPESIPELDRMVELLIEYPFLKIEIHGHTDNIGNDRFNNNLSNQRAKSVYNYLVSQGIDEARISSKGFGRKKPVADNSTDEGRQKNRRVEFLIVGK